MSFIPLTTPDAGAVTDSLRVGLANSVHAGERTLDVTLDTISDLAHHSAVCVDNAVLSSIQYQQSLISARTCRDVWSAATDHGTRLRDAYFKLLHECFECRSRAFNRLTKER